MANHIGNKVTVGAPYSRARFENANRICADCLEHSKVVMPEISEPYKALCLGDGFLSLPVATCYVCEQRKTVAVVEYNKLFS